MLNRLYSCRGFGVQGDAGRAWTDPGAPGAICSARCERLGLLITSELDRQTRRPSHHPGRTTPLGLLAGRRALFELKDGFVRGMHPRVRNTPERCNQMHLVSVVNCDEGEIVRIQQLEYVGARGKHFPRNWMGW